MPKSYTVEARGSTAMVQIIGDIGPGGITAAQFAKDLKLLGSNVREIEVMLSSGGGSVIEALGIAGALQSHNASVNIAIQGAAISAASAIAMSADRLTMTESSVFMMHLPYVDNTGGTAEDLRSTAEAIDRMTASLVAIYRRRFKMTDDEITALLKSETWYSAQELKDLGVVDEVIEGDEEEMAIAASFDLSRYSIPDHLKGKIIMPQKNEVTAADKTAILAAEKKRRAEIESVFHFHGDDYSKLRDRCLDDANCSTARARELLLEALGRGRGPLGAGNQNTITAGADQLADFKAAATDALLAREGIKVAEPHAAARDLSRMSIVGMAETVLRQHGVSTASMSATAILNRATHSTSDFPALLANVAGKSLMQGYDNEPASHRIWTPESEVPDFKTQSRVQLSEAPSLDEVKEGGEYTHGTFGDAKEEFQLVTYGRAFSITRQALINDDLSAFTRLPLAFGASASRREADEVYGILTTNAAMSDGTALFHASHGNLETAAALSIASLGTARAAMRIQTGLNGLATLNIVPRYLIVPAALETTAEQLLASLVDPAKSNSTPNLDFIRGLTLVVDARLDADSTTAWYLAADSMQVDTIERAYLEGQRGVSYEERPGWEIDGMEVKARLDFAAKAIDYRGLLKNPGA